MNPSATFAFLITTAQILAAAVNTRDNLHLRPALARKAVATRLVTGLRFLRAFVRRLIILIALEMEWTLVDTRGPMKRSHGLKNKKSSATLSIRGLDPDKVSPWLVYPGPQFKPRFKIRDGQPVHVDMAKLYAQLDFLSKIAANPAAKATRLAFRLARSRPSVIIIPPDGPMRIAGRWGTAVRACYDSMHPDIIEKSRNRPPPLPPPRNCWPTVTAL